MMMAIGMLRMALASTVVAQVLLLGAGAAQALTVQTSDGGTHATGILDLVVDGTLYDVTFVRGTAEEVYGAFPGSFAFTTVAQSEEAANAVNDALDTVASVRSVGPAGAGGSQYRIAYDSDEAIAQVANVQEPFYFDDINRWVKPPEDAVLWLESLVYADFTEAVVPEPATILLLGLGLAGLSIARRDGGSGA